MHIQLLGPVQIVDGPATAPTRRPAVGPVVRGAAQVGARGAGAVPGPGRHDRPAGHGGVGRGPARVGAQHAAAARLPPAHTAAGRLGRDPRRDAATPSRCPATAPICRCSSGTWPAATDTADAEHRCNGIHRGARRRSAGLRSPTCGRWSISTATRSGIEEQVLAAREAAGPGAPAARAARRPSSTTWPGWRPSTPSPKACRSCTSSPATGAASRPRRSRHTGTSRTGWPTSSASSPAPGCAPRGRACCARTRSLLPAGRREASRSSCGTRPDPATAAGRDPRRARRAAGTVSSPRCGRTGRHRHRHRRRRQDDAGCPRVRARSRRTTSPAVSAGPTCPRSSRTGYAARVIRRSRASPGRVRAGYVEAVEAAVADARTLLVLDSCEHVVGEVADVVTTLTSRCPALVVLATSRERLRAQGEAVLRPASRWRCPDAAGRAGRTRPGRRPRRPQRSTCCAGSAVAAEPGFALTPDNAPAVARICWDLDGLPLALELAAARLRSMTARGAGRRPRRPVRRAHRWAADRRPNATSRSCDRGVEPSAARRGGAAGSTSGSPPSVTVPRLPQAEYVCA